jgi:serine/threonine protein kinase
MIKLDRELRIKIVDFGNACHITKKFTDNIQTREYRSPEAILGIDYGANTDIWSLACVVFELLTCNYLFKPKRGKGYGKSDV